MVLAVALIVGGQMENFNPRKRYVMYPVFVGWIVGAGRRRASQATESDSAAFDAEAYFANPRQVYTSAGV